MEQPPDPPSDLRPVLVADDHVVSRMVAFALLEELGCAVDMVENGRDAVEAVARTPYALVLMDCEMPEMDGFQATAAIRALERQRGTRTFVVAMTANAVAGERDRCIAAGMDDYLCKPITLEELAELLHRPPPVAAPPA